MWKLDRGVNVKIVDDTWLANWCIHFLFSRFPFTPAVWCIAFNQPFKKKQIMCIDYPLKIGVHINIIIVILSPRLFSLYIDELSDRLSKSNIGCFIDGTCMNHFFYADDICLLAPSAISLQELINRCATYGEEHDILYNPLKSKSI